MQNVLSEYKGVILFTIVLVLMMTMLNNRVKELNAIDTTNTVAYYEK